MNDAPLQALYGAIDHSRPGLLLADEHCLEAPPPNAQLQVITNRFDVARRMQSSGFGCDLNDFVLPADLPERVYYRVSKEKALVHNLINEVLSGMPVGGHLALSGFKSDGAKTYIEKASQMVGSAKSIKKLAGGALLASIHKHKQPETRLDDSDYHTLRSISTEPPLYSKPGVYGWKKIDSGSALLAEQLITIAEAHPQPIENVLDIGCGYGYLSVMAKQYFPAARIVATDNNVTALLACEKNFALHAIDGEVLADDCGAALTQQFDLVVCNPPFHKGFDIHGDLTLQFLQSAKARLKRGGLAVFVVNQFIGLEQRAASLFASCQAVAERDGFRVYSLS